MVIFPYPLDSTTSAALPAPRHNFDPASSTKSYFSLSPHGFATRNPRLCARSTNAASEISPARFGFLLNLHPFSLSAAPVKTGISDNVGGVKHVATTLPHALEQERHFALIGEVLNPTKARFLISIQVGKLSSTHASLRSQARS